jgi:uncharacterized membrane protein
MEPRSFVDRLENERIVQAIREVEARSRGEVRVHVSEQPVEDAQAAAAAVFEKLGMAATGERNGVLLFVAPRSHKFAVIGDAGIHARCGDAFWSSVAAALQEDFKAGRFTEGIVSAVGRVGAVLAEHFPRLTEREDRNELPDEVSRG